MSSSNQPPPIAPKPKPALLSYLSNGNNHPGHKSSPLAARRASINAQEKERLTASIHSSHNKREPIELNDLRDALPTQDRYLPDGQETHDAPPTNLNVPARDPRDSEPFPASTSSHPASPYTLNPPIDFDGLSWPSVGTRDRLEDSTNPASSDVRLKKLEGAITTILECIGEDPAREGLRGTPERYAKAMLFFTKGYEENVRDLVNGAVFHEDHDELVIVKDIEVFSLCEHHMVPFTGTVSCPLSGKSRKTGFCLLTCDCAGRCTLDTFRIV